MIETLTFLLVIITAFYAWATFKILKANEAVVLEMQRQYDALNRPHIVITPVTFPDLNMMFLKIKNTGKTAAINLKMAFDKDFYKLGEQKEGHNLRHYKAFSTNIDSFAPDAEMLFYLAQGFVIFGKDAKENLTPPIFTITADYEYDNKKTRENTIIDLRPYLDSALPQDPIVKKLNDIKESIDKIK